MTGPINQGLNILIGMRMNGRVDSSFVTIAQEEPDASWLGRFKEAGIDIAQFNIPLWKSLLAIPKLRKYVQEKRVVIIHASGYRAVFIAMLARTKAKIVITQRCHPNESVEKFPKFIQPVFNSFYLWMIRRVDSVVACSKSIQHILNTEFNMEAECVQNGVNTDFFVPSTIPLKEQLRKELNLPLDKTLYLVLGSLRGRKNNSLVVDAFKRIGLSNAVAVIVGDGPEEEMLKNMAQGFSNIMMVGSTKTPVKYLQACDILVSASLAEGLPNTVLEALSCGLPCILSDIEPHKELIEGTGAGLIYTRHSVEELCKCILASKEWNLSKKSMIAREIAVNNYGVKSLAAKYEVVYHNTLNQQV